jgi:hypothetical protein
VRIRRRGACLSAPVLASFGLPQRKTHRADKHFTWGVSGKSSFVKCSWTDLTTTTFGRQRRFGSGKHGHRSETAKATRLPLRSPSAWFFDLSSSARVCRHPRLTMPTVQVLLIAPEEKDLGYA